MTTPNVEVCETRVNTSSAVKSSAWKHFGCCLLKECFIWALPDLPGCIPLWLLPSFTELHHTVGDEEGAYLLSSG